jgi:hypothetical protein
MIPSTSAAVSLAGGGEGDSERIERACADIPEDDADRGEREEEGAAFVQFAAAGRIDGRLLRRGALGIHGSYPFAHSRRFSTVAPANACSLTMS